jgi:hypothetical protein
MKKILAIFTSIILLGMTISANADAGMDRYNEAMEEVNSIYSLLNGLEVEGTAFIGYNFMDALKINPVGDSGTFSDLSFGFYDAQLDAGRDARKLLQGCKTSLSKTNCKVSFKAELEVSGRSITYLVYEVSDLVRD